MSRTILLLPLAVALGLGIFLTRPASTEAPMAGAPASSPAANQAPTRAAQRAATGTAPQVMAKLPDSFKGTQVDGQFQLDTAGNLIIDRELRQFLSQPVEIESCIDQRPQDHIPADTRETIEVRYRHDENIL